MKKKRKALFLGSIPAIILIIVGTALLAQPPPTAQEELPIEELPTETPPNLLVIPEVPLGTLTIILACFFALIISQMKPKTKLQ